MADYEAMADAVVLAMKTALVPFQARLEAVQAQVAELQRRGQDDSLAKEVGSLRERVAVVEVKPAIPGPPGAAGQDGLGFDDLSVEFDGERTMALTFVKGHERKSFPVTLPFTKFKGPYQPGQSYNPGDEVLKGNGTKWTVTAHEATITVPGESKAWTMSGRGSK